MSHALHAYRGAILHCLDDPSGGAEKAIEYLPDGLLLVEDGHIAGIGPAAELLARLPAGTPLREERNALIVPGFIDCHVHFPQLDAIAAPGGQLLQWLERYAFPAEARCADPAHARELAGVFLDELLRNGTTSALVFASVHPHSVDALFEQAERRDMRLIAGKVLMDRNAPDALLESVAEAERHSRELIRRWHGRGRLHYALTPRFAPSCSEALLACVGRLLSEQPDLYLHTHLAENRAELAWVEQLFPQQRSYLDVYDQHGLLGPRSVFAHALHLHSDDCQRLGESGSAVAFCPASNLFLGSGLFDLARMRRHGVAVGLGSDIGAGTSLSALRNLADGYKVLQLQGQTLAPLQAFYLATLGSARALQLQERIGNLAPGREADFLILDLAATPLLARRIACAASLEEQLFALMILGDDRAVRETFVAGRSRHRREA